MAPVRYGFPGTVFLAAALLAACGGGGAPEQPAERITDPARVASAEPLQDPTLFTIEGNEVILSGGSSGAITPTAPTTPVASSDYVVKSGDVCSSIAAEHKISVDDLLKANRTADCSNLRIGDTLKIPAPVVATPTRGAVSGNPTVRPGTGGNAKTYTVKAGDTCGAIASQHGVTLADFLAANSSIDADCTNIRDGQVVTIP